MVNNELVNIDKNNGSVDIKLPNGGLVTHYLSPVSAKFIGKLVPGEVKISYSDEMDENGIPVISFIQNVKKVSNSTFKKDLGLPTFQKEAREEKALTMLVAYSKDFAIAIIDHATKANIAIDTGKIMDDSNIQILKSYQFFKEAMEKLN